MTITDRALTLADGWEEKVRYVRTQAGVRRFNLPVGSPIGGGVPIQLEIPGLPPKPLGIVEQRDVVRIHGTPSARARRLLAKKKYERLEALYDEYINEYDQDKPDKYTEALNELYALDIDVDQERQTLASTIAAGGGWVQWDPCRAMRASAYELLGYDRIENSVADPYLTARGSLRGDAANYSGDPHPSPQSDINAYGLLKGLRDGEILDRPLYRGVTMYKPDEFIASLREGQVVDLPLASFVDDRKSADRFGNHVVFVVERGARVVTGSYMAPNIPDDDSDEYWEAWEDEEGRGINYERVSGGRFRIRSFKKRQDGGYTVQLRQVAVFDPDTAEAIEVKDAKGEERKVWEWDHLFDFPLAKPRNRVAEKAMRIAYKVKDGDGDGFIYDGTPRQRPAPKKIIDLGIPRFDSEQSFSTEPEYRVNDLPLKELNLDPYEVGAGSLAPTYKDAHQTLTIGPDVPVQLSQPYIWPKALYRYLDDPRVDRIEAAIYEDPKYGAFVVLIEGHHRLIAARAHGLPVKVKIRTKNGEPFTGRLPSMDIAEKAFRLAGKARDGDGDGFVYDGTPRMRPAVPGTDVVPMWRGGRIRGHRKPKPRLTDEGDAATGRRRPRGSTLQREQSEYQGWRKYRDPKTGKAYYVGKDEDDWVVTGEDDFILARGDTEGEALRELLKYTGRPRPSKRAYMETMRPAKSYEEALAFVKKYGQSIPRGWGELHIQKDPNYSGAVLAAGIQSDGTWRAVYSRNLVDTNAQTKWQRVGALEKHIGSLDRKIAKSDPEDPNVAIVRIVRLTGMRPDSSPRQRGEVQTFGAASLQARHVKIDGDTVTFDFIGKAGKRNTIEVEDKEFADVMRLHKGDKQGNEEMFPGARPDLANKWLADATPVKITNKDLRTYLANVIAVGVLQDEFDANPPANATQFKKMRNRIGDAVSGVLGNTRAVALSNYVNPAVFLPYDREGWSNS